MAKFNYSCEECNSIFRITFNEESVDGDVSYCPFCGLYIRIENFEKDVEKFYIREEDDYDLSEEYD